MATLLVYVAGKYLTTWSVRAEEADGLRERMQREYPGVSVRPLGEVMRPTA